MGRKASHNWQKLFLEYNQGRYKNVAEFAKAKDIYPDRMRKEFRKLANETESKQVKKSPNNESKQVKKNDSKNDASQKQVKTVHPWETLKKQFLDWPDEKLQTYLTQLEARKAELESIPFEDLAKDEIKELGQVRRERRAILSDPDPERKCSAHNHDGSPCGNPVEQGKNVCWNHGGASTGPPKGSKNALKHGAYETIWFDQLDNEERGLAEQVAQDKIKALEEEIMLLTVRERRMLARIARLSGEDFTTVKIKYEKGLGPQGPVDKVDKESHATLGQIQEIEKELTKVQDKKLKAIELKHKLDDEGKGKGDISALDRFLQSVDEIAGDVDA